MSHAWEYIVFWAFTMTVPFLTKKYCNNNTIMVIQYYATETHLHGIPRMFKNNITTIENVHKTMLLFDIP